MESTGIRIVTLDVGGTLVHPFPSVGEVYAEVLAAHGVVVEPSLVQARFHQVFFGRPMGPRATVDDAAEKEMWAALVGEVVGPFCPADLLPAVFEELFETFARPCRWRMVEDAVPTIQSLSASGFEVAILSNADSRLRQVLGGLGLLSLVGRVFISAELGFEKPDIRIFRHVERDLGWGPEAFLHVGDSDFHDGAGARAAGWRYLIVDGVFDPASHRITCLSDVIRCLQG